MKLKRILIAEDEPNISFALSLELKKAGFEAAVAGDGQLALNMISAADSQGAPFDLLVMDVEMPNLTGLQLLEKLNSLGMDLPCVVITGFMTRDIVSDIVSKRPCLCLEKPFRSEALIAMIRQLLAGGDENGHLAAG